MRFENQTTLCTNALYFVGPLCPPLLPPHSPLSSPMPPPHLPPPLYCGSAHTWPSQIRALEKQCAERKAGCVVEMRGSGGEGVWSMGSFSIPMEQKVNDRAIVLWESWPEEKCYREITACASEQWQKGAGHMWHWVFTIFISLTWSLYVTSSLLLTTQIWL